MSCNKTIIEKTIIDTQIESGNGFLKKTSLIGLSIITVLSLTACGNYGDSESAGDSSAGDSTSITLTAEGEASTGLTYTPLGDGAILVEVDCGDGDGDCAVDVNQQIAMGDAALDAHFLGDGHTDTDGTCPFALANLEAAEIAEGE